MVKFVKDNVIPLAGLSGYLMQGVRDSMHRPSSLTPPSLSMQTRATSLLSHEKSSELSLDDDAVVEELRRYITTFLFAECMDGISADVQLFLRKPRSIIWCSPSVFWSDFDYAVPLLSKIIDEEIGLHGRGRSWVVDTFHAQIDAMVGEKGRVWFDSCWMSHQLVPELVMEENVPSSHLPVRNSFKYTSQVVEGTEHNYLMDPAFGASKMWLQRVRDAFSALFEVWWLESNVPLTQHHC